MKSTNKKSRPLYVIPSLLLLFMFVLQGCGLLNNANNEPNSGNPQTEEGISETNKNEADVFHS